MIPMILTFFGTHFPGEKDMKTAKKVLTYSVIVGIALICALNYKIFIFPNRFAQYGAIMQCVEPVTGSSGRASFGANTRETQS